MREFNLEEAKAGKPVCTRYGLNARILCFDRKSHGSVYPIIGLVEYLDGEENVKTWGIDGRYCVGEVSHEDLVMDD